MADATAVPGGDTDRPAPLPAGALDAMSASIAIIDPTGTIVVVNSAWRRFATENGGGDPGHFLGWNYLAQCDRVDPTAPEAEFAAAAAEGLRRILKGEADGFVCEYPCHGPRQARWMRLGAHSVVHPRGAFAAVAHEDVTERVLAEQERDQQLALLQAMFDAALDAIVTIDEHGTIEAVNAAARRLFGYEPARLLGQKVAILLSPAERARVDRLLATIPQSRTGEPVLEQEIVGQRRDGTLVPFILRVAEARVGGRRLLMGVLHDLTERRAAEAARLEKEQRDLVVHELGHRMKNVFATVSSVAQMLARTSGSVAEYRDALLDRLKSLAATLVLLTEGGRLGVMLDELIAFELAAYVTEGRMIDLVGDQLRLSAQAGQLIGMAIHELATNAAKYGALSSPSGRLTVRWRCVGTGASSRVDLTWVERGGPLVMPPSRKGFGSTLIERSLRVGLGAEVVLDYLPEGLTCRICLPLDRISARRDRASR